ncbi:ATP-binding protein [Pedobacter boryungensis]|uniref:histidine kinase n=1 Tax=Pedobacter boryungensis TaxID=869962 RepID=A0ABX2DAY6_9SPHI|nr:tetratricopeptide repeat protein [Pedobacter boryungensis]NQX31217.1 tetratricopeptide repeat protein [Pedobacter boryungensis]
MNYKFTLSISKICFLTYCLLLISIATFAQVKSPQLKLDSLLKVNANHVKQDSAKLVILKEVYYQSMRVKNFEKSEEFVNKSVLLARKLNLRRFEAQAYYKLGMFYHGFTNFYKAEENYKKAIAAYTAINDLDWVAGTYLNLGALYTGVPYYVKALDAHQKAIDIFLKNGNEVDLASCYANISGIYMDLGQQDYALNYLQKALKIFIKEDPNDRGVAVVYNSIGQAYFTASKEELIKMGAKPNQKNALALENYKKALNVAQVNNDSTVLGPLNKDFGNVYEAMGEKDLALKAYQKANEINSKADHKDDYANSLLALSNFYEKNNEYSKAEDLLIEALKIGQQVNLLNVQRDAYLNLSSINEKQGDFNQSLKNYRQYIRVRDQIFNQEKEKEIIRRQLQIDFGVKEKDYQLKQQLTDVELQRQVLLAKQQQQELTLSNQEKILQRLTFLKKQADLENEKRSQANLLKQQRLKAQLDKEIKDKQIGLQRTELKFNRNVNLILGILASILLASALFVYYTQRKTAKLNKIVSEQKLELEKLGKVKDRIFSVVSHDMRSPVNSLISFIQLLEDGNINQQDLTKYAGLLKTTLGYTSSMMENLLNWASSQMQGFKPIIERFDVELCAQEVLNSLHANAVQKNITIINEIKSGSICLADMNMTALVLRNLISNSIKFSAKNETIKLSSKVENNTIAISVIDNGVGLLKEQIDNFNNSGYQEIGKSTIGTNQEKGTGIGLVLCHTFTTLMNGSLKVKSVKNKGSVFTLALPKA